MYEQTLPLSESRGVRALLIVVALASSYLFLIAAIARRLHRGFASGPLAYWAALVEPETLAAMRLTLLTAFVVVPINTLFGVAAAWGIAKFTFVAEPADYPH